MIKNTLNQINEKEMFNYSDYYQEKDEIKKIEMCLNYINEKLKSNSISVMIGAGFSLNANEGKTSNEAKYEDWGNLLKDAYKEIYPDKTTNLKEEIISKGESVVAEEFEKLKGTREALDLYIENKLLKIDKKTNNLSCHEKLLNLGWGDIITTNWDDLLEQSNINNYFYPVFRAKDLRCRPNKRIVKLNGSVRTLEQIDKKDYCFDDTYNYLYVITTNDFKTYNKDHQDFSNFMKVKVLESPFCLMGFSGRDLNFRYWIKELKRAMLKGGNTEYPNPIFLFDVNPNGIKKEDEEYEKSLELFYHNNYIIRIKILDYYNYINSQKLSSDKEVTLKTQKEITYSDLNNFIFNSDLVFKQKKSINENSSFPQKQGESNYSILRNIVSSHKNMLSSEDIIQYNSIELFSIQNIFFTSSFIDKIQALYNNLDSWTKDIFIFLYRWCLSNYYSLINLFDEEKIEKIIQHYNEKSFSKTEACVFSELILKFYRETDNLKKFDIFCNKEKNNSCLKNIIYFEKALSYIDQLNYKEFNKLLINWQPEKDKIIDSLFVLRKISLLTTFENPREQEKNELFNIALKSCSNQQMKCFILVYQKSYLFYSAFETRYLNQNLLDQIILSGFHEPKDYLKYFSNDSSQTSYKPNEDTRYLTIRKLFNDNKNIDYFNSIRILNFCEFTGLPFAGLIPQAEFIKMIVNLKNYSYYLKKVLLGNISNFGNDSTEGFLRLLIEKTARFLPLSGIEELFISFFDILKIKIDKNQNARSCFFLLSELSKYISSNKSRIFFDYFYSQILASIEHDNQTKLLITQGRHWGILITFEQYIKQLTDPTQYSVVLKWVIQNYISNIQDCLKKQSYLSSEYFTYYFELINKENMKEEIKKVFQEKEIEGLLEEDYKLEKQLVLFGFKYLNKRMQIAVEKWCIENFTVQLDPYLIILFSPSILIKEKVLTVLQEYDIFSYNSKDYQLTDYIRALNQKKLLDITDKERVATILLNNCNKILNNKDTNKYFFNTPENILSMYFFALVDVTTSLERKKSPIIQRAYTTIKKAFKSTIGDFYNLAWLYTDNMQEFRSSYLKAFSYFSYLNKISMHLDVFNIGLSKIVVQDDKEFEAVLEQFIRLYKMGFSKNLFINNGTTSILLQILKKFKLEIPYCYDYLFIKEQIYELALAMKKFGINSKMIEQWVSNK